MMELKNTLYAQYILEREGFEIIENETSFIVYKLKGEIAFIAHSFTVKEYRMRGSMSHLLDLLKSALNKDEVKVLSATIDLRDRNATSTLQAALRYGFQVKAAENGILYIEDEIGER